MTARYSACMMLLLPALAAVLAGCDRSPERTAQGYVEGDFVFIAAERAGRIAELPLAEGSHAEVGTLLFRLDTGVEEAALAAAEARAAEAEQQLEDLMRGARPQRLAVLEAAIGRAEANLELARRRLERRQALVAGPAISQEDLDEAQAAFEVAQAEIAEAREQLALEAMPAREDRIEAARAALDAARAEADQQRREIGRHAVRVPASGLVQEIVRRPGEVTPSGGTVAVFLPDDARRAIFFVSQSQVPGLALGDEVGIGCDGCPPGLSAPIDFIAREVEFTPPVIFGPQQRERLLVRVEAQIAADRAPQLKPGQPITVTLPDAGAPADD